MAITYWKKALRIAYWKPKILRIVLLPTLAGILLAGVSVFRGYLHHRAGFDAEGQPLDAASRSAGASGPKDVPRRSISKTALFTRIRDDLGHVETAAPTRVSVLLARTPV